MRLIGANNPKQPSLNLKAAGMAGSGCLPEQGTKTL
jgi:hypothetical protein